VADQTALAGKFDFTLKLPFANMTLMGMMATQSHAEGRFVILSRTTSPDRLDAFPVVSAAVEKQLRLKLEPRRVPMDTLVIDHIQKTPTEN
jgi:uncharacterized protein (TIGR03435 family)